MQIPHWFSFISVEWVVFIALLIAIICWIKIYADAQNKSAAHGALAFVLALCCLTAVQVIAILVENEIADVDSLATLWLYRATIFLFGIGSWLRYAGR